MLHDTVRLSDPKKMSSALFDMGVLEIADLALLDAEMMQELLPLFKPVQRSKFLKLMKAVFGDSEKEMADQEERVALASASNPNRDRTRGFGDRTRGFGDESERTGSALDLNGFDVKGFDVKNLLLSPAIKSSISSSSSSSTTATATPLQPTRPKLSSGPGRNAQRVVVSSKPSSASLLED